MTICCHSVPQYAQHETAKSNNIIGDLYTQPSSELQPMLAQYLIHSQDSLWVDGEVQLGQGPNAVGHSSTGLPLCCTDVPDRSRLGVGHQTAVSLLRSVLSLCCDPDDPIHAKNELHTCNSSRKTLHGLMMLSLRCTSAKHRNCFGAPHVPVA